MFLSSANEKLALDLHVEKFMCVCLFVSALYFWSFSVTNFLGFKLANALVSGRGSDIPLI